MTVGVLYIALLQWLCLAVHNTCCNKWLWLCPAVHCTHCNDCDCTWLYTIHVAMTVTVPGCTLYMLQWLWLYLAVHCTCCNDCACCLPITAHSTPGRDCTLLHNSCTFSAHHRGPARHSITTACCTHVCDSAPCSTVGVWLHNAAATPCTVPLWLDAQCTLQWLCPCTLLLLPGWLYIVHAVVTVHAAQGCQLCLDLRVFVQFINLLRLDTSSVRP